MAKPLEVYYDDEADILLVDGVRFTGHYFRSLANAPVGAWLRIEERNGNTLTIFCPSDTTAHTFDVIAGRTVPSRASIHLDTHHG